MAVNFPLRGLLENHKAELVSIAVFIPQSVMRLSGEKFDEMALAFVVIPVISCN